MYKDRKNGYAQKSYKGKRWKHHRLAYYLEYGPIPKGMMVCHKCDVPSCINPDHLFLGTHQDNMDDRTNKGRHSQGVKHTISKFKDEQDIIDIRNSKLSLTQLARKYKVSYPTIRKIKAFQTYQNVEGIKVPGDHLDHLVRPLKCF